MVLTIRKNRYNKLPEEIINIEIPDPSIPWQKSGDILPPELQFGDPESTMVGIWSIKDSSVVLEFEKMMDCPSYWPFYEFGLVTSDRGIIILEGIDLIIVELTLRFEIIHIM